MISSKQLIFKTTNMLSIVGEKLNFDNENKQ